jgi:hypothetical protein
LSVQPVDAAGLGSPGQAASSTPRGTRPAASSCTANSAVSCRDQWLLEPLGKHRALTTEQVAALAFDHLNAARDV